VFNYKNNLLGRLQIPVFVVLCLTGFFLFLPFKSLRAESQPKVVINEVVYDQAGTDSEQPGQEWVELYNNSDSAVDLAGYFLEWGGASFDDNSISLSGIIPAKQYFLIGGNSVEAKWGVKSDLITDSLVMQNGGSESDGVRLFDGAGYYDTLLYDEPNKNGLPADDSNPGLELCPDVTEDHSLSRRTVGVDNNLASDWEDLQTPTPHNSNYDESIIDTGNTTSNQIIINELLPNPNGSDDNEWLELKNLSTTTIDLTNWKISDLAGTDYAIANTDFATTTISALGFFILPKSITKISLNNSGGETVRLFDNQNNLVFEISYNETASDDFVWARDESGVWHWSTTQTLGAENIITAPVASGPGGGSSYEPKKYPSQIKINEIFPNPPGADSNEWIELKNISGNIHSLKGWQLIGEKDDVQIMFDAYAKITKASPLFLLERTDNNSAPAVDADVIYQGALSQKNDGLRLFDNNCVLIDEVLARSEWPAGDAVQRRTMERGANFSWHTHQGVGLGTPRAENSNFTPSFSSGGGSGGSSGGSSEQASSNAEIPNTIACVRDGAVPASQKPVRINEVQWMGTLKSSSDEWIELMNETGAQISLKGWHLRDKDNEIAITFEAEDVIGSSGFYVLERTDEGTLPSIAAKKIYTGGLENSNEALYLYNSSCELVDEVNASSEWPGGSKDERRSMERKNNSEWGTYEGDTSSEIFGTPGKENSGEVSRALLATSTTGHILISELYPDQTGSNKDFVELYNPTNQNLSLDNMWLWVSGPGNDEGIETESPSSISLHEGKAIIRKNKPAITAIIRLFIYFSFSQFLSDSFHIPSFLLFIFHLNV